MIFALFRLILPQFWASELPKIRIYIKSTRDTVLSILPCPRAMVKVILKIKKNLKFQGGGAVMRVRKFNSPQHKKIKSVQGRCYGRALRASFSYFFIKKFSKNLRGKVDLSLFERVHVLRGGGP